MPRIGMSMHAEISPFLSLSKFRLLVRKIRTSRLVPFDRNESSLRQAVLSQTVGR